MYQSNLARLRCTACAIVFAGIPVLAGAAEPTAAEQAQIADEVNGLRGVAESSSPTPTSAITAVEPSPGPRCLPKADIGLENEELLFFRAGNDRLTRSASQTDTVGCAVGILNGDVIAMGGGRDTLGGKADAKGRVFAEAIGVLNEGKEAGTLLMQSGNDAVRGAAKAEAVDGDSLALGISNINRETLPTEKALLATGDGSDLIEGSADSTGTGDVAAFAVQLANTFTEGRSDKVKGTAKALGVAATEARGVSVGVSDIDDDTVLGEDSDQLIPPEVGFALLGSGNDVVEGIAEVTAISTPDNPLDGDIFFAGANGIIVDGGRQADVRLVERGILKKLPTSTLDTGPGNDVLRANVKLKVKGGLQGSDGGDPDLEVIADAIENAGTIRLGPGNDRIEVKVQLESEGGSKALADGLDNSSVGIITGLGQEVSGTTLLDLGPGNDKIVSTVSSKSTGDFAAANGLDTRSRLNAGPGNDEFMLTATSEFIDDRTNGDQEEAIADGLENRNEVFLGGGNDTITAKATATGNGRFTFADGIESRKLFDTGRGSDTLNLSGTAIASDGVPSENITAASGILTEQVEAGTLRMGSGNDRIIAKGTAIGKGNRASIGIGITQVSADIDNVVPDETGLIDTGSGRDKLEGHGEASGQLIVAAFGFLVTNLLSGSDADTLKGVASATEGRKANAVGISVGVPEDKLLNEILPQEKGPSKLDTGPGGDTLSGVADARGAGSGHAYGIYVADGSTLSTGAGDDIINAESAAGGGAVEAFDIFGGGTIDTGANNDRIVTAVSNAGLDINSFGDGVKVNMGPGNDFVLGFGDAEIDGGAGRRDELAFGFSRDVFDKAGGGIEVNGRAVDFTVSGVTLKTRRFEVFTFAGQSFGANQL